MQAHFREQVIDTFDTGIQRTVSKFSDAGIIDPDWKADQVVYRTGAQVTFVETKGQRGGNTQQGEWQAGFRSGWPLPAGRNVPRFRQFSPKKFGPGSVA